MRKLLHRCRTHERGRYPRRRVRVDEHTIELASSPAFYRSSPVQGLPSVYLHGVPTSSDDWVSFLQRRGGVAPDLIGFGRSGKSGHLDYSIEGLADFLERLLSELGVDRFQLVAHDWGAVVGLELAFRHPNAVQRIVLFDPPALLEGFRWHRLARLWRTPGIGELVMGSTNRWLLATVLRRGAVEDRSWPDERVAAVWEQFDQGTQRAILRLHRRTNEEWLSIRALGAGAPTAPTLLICGDRDPWLAPALPDAYAAILPNARVERIAQAGHWPWLDRPEVIDRVAEFLEETP
jgi:pimeloyl-ACP methyl ester carboxylesterase